MARATDAAGIKKLKDFNWCSIENHSEFGTGKKVNVYIINPKVQWLNFREKTQKFNLSKSSAVELPKVQQLNSKSSVVEHEPSLEPSLRTVINAPKPKKFTPSLMRPSGVSSDSWNSLIEHRKKKRAANTKRAYQLLLAEFKKSGLPIEKCIDMMILRDWRGFNSEWIQNRNGKQHLDTCQTCRNFCLSGAPDKCHKSGSRKACHEYA
jgi:hypothetical protein